MDFTQTQWNKNSYQDYIEYLKNLADDEYKKFVENQINELLKMQNTAAEKSSRGTDL